MPEGVNSLVSPQTLQCTSLYPSLPVALSYLLPLAVTPHLIRSASFLGLSFLALYTAMLSHLDSVYMPPSFHPPICLTTCLCPASLLKRARQL